MLPLRILMSMALISGQRLFQYGQQQWKWLLGSRAGDRISLVGFFCLAGLIRWTCIVDILCTSSCFFTTKKSLHMESRIVLRSAFPYSLSIILTRRIPHHLTEHLWVEVSELHVFYTSYSFVLFVSSSKVVLRSWSAGTAHPSFVSYHNWYLWGFLGIAPYAELPENVLAPFSDADRMQ